jgi:hypothetical protein
MAKTTKAYRSKSFLSSTDARPIRILSEYLEPKSRFDHYKVEDTIVFYGSARIPSPAQAEESHKAAREAGEDLARAETDKELSRYYEATRELAYRLTEWSKGLGEGGRRFVVCSGGGPGIMEAANRGASEAKGLNVGLNISLPFEESANPYISRELNFNFHYFFMRKFWFTYLAKALVVMPGGFGTLDEFFETMTLIQTGKMKKHMPIVLFGSKYWSDVLNFDALVDYGTISAKDLDLFFRTDSVDEAFDYITGQLKSYALDNPGAKL